MHIRKPSFNFLYFYVSYQSISCFAPSADDQFGSCLWFEQPTATRQQSWLNLFAVLERLGQLMKLRKRHNSVFSFPAVAVLPI